MTFTEFPAKFGKYILLDRLAAGGMAEVFRAKVTGVEGFERLVAIKCMLPSMVEDEHFTSMFVDEARLAAQVGHTNVVQIYELGRERERLYIAMELIAGRDLRHILKTAEQKNIKLPPQFAAYVAGKTAEGLDFAHRKAGADGAPLGLVHRDVSPQNILVSYDGVVKVVDFGIAKASTEARNTQTQVGILKGKFAYMAPEQVTGLSLDRRADIFALGSVLYEMLCNQRLFRGDSDLTVLEHVREAIVPDFSIDLPPEAQRLVPVLNRALALNLDDRFAWASEMAEALEPMLIDEQSIFGAKRAAAIMRELFAEEVVKLAQDVKRFAEITMRDASSPAENTDVTKAPAASGHMVFESTFASSSSGPRAEGSGRTSSRPDATGEMQRPGGLRMTTQPAVRNPAYGVEASQGRNLPRPSSSQGQSSRPRRVELPKKQAGPAQAGDARRAAPTQAVPPPYEPGRDETPMARQATQLLERNRNTKGVLKKLRVYVGLAACVTAALIGVLSLSGKSPLAMLKEDVHLAEMHPLAAISTLWQDVRGSSFVDRWLFGGTRAQVSAEREALSNITLPADGSKTSSHGVSFREDDGGDDDGGEDAEANRGAEGEGAAAGRSGPSRPPGRAEGFLRVAVTGASRARIQIDGRDMGLAPLPPVRLKVGTHKVRVTYSSPGGTQHTRQSTVEVSGGDSQETPAAIEINF